jgi:hypothetical protein
VVSRAVSLAEITAVERVDNDVRVWVQGESKPALSVDGTSQGSSVLLTVLREMIGSKSTPPATVSRVLRAPEAVEPLPIADEPAALDISPAQTEAEGGTELGRLLFSRSGATERDAYNSKIVGTVLGGLSLVGLLISIFVQVTTSRATGGIVLSFVGLLISVGILVEIWIRGSRLFQCYERGIFNATRSGQATVTYQEVSAFSYTGVRQFVNGMYMSTRVQLIFERFDGEDPLIYKGESAFDDEQLDGLRDHISRVVAGHLLNRLRNGETVVWTPQLAFTPEGLVVSRVEKKGARGETRIVPYDQLGEHEFKEGVFYLHTKDGFGRPIQDPVSQRNFFPGYYLMLLLNSAAQPDTSGTADAGE